MQIGPPPQLGQLSPAPPLPPPTNVDTSQPPPPPPRPGTAAGASPWPIVAAVLVALWAMAVTITAQGVGWLVDQGLLEGGLNRPFWWWPAVTAVNAVLAGVPAGLLAALPRSPAVRAAGRAWLLAAAALGALGLVRAIPMPHNELYLAALALLAASGALLVPRLRGHGRDRDRERRRTTPVAVLLAVAAGSAAVLPWLWAGALGGLLESALAVSAAAAVGWLAAAILDPAYWAPYAVPSRRRALRLLLVGGPVAGVALFLVAAGVGQSGVQPAMMLVLPPLAFAAAALLPMSTATVGGPAFIAPGTPHRARPPVGWLVALAAVGPLAFADPEEISVPLIFGRDVPFWVAVAAACSAAVALLLGLAYAVAFARGNAPIPRRGLAAVAAAVLVFAATAVYVGLGQPGLHGERLFVVMKQQADLGGISTGTAGQAGRDARAREVYRRLVDTATGSQAGLRRELDRRRLDYTPYYVVNAVEVEGGPAVRAWLSARDDVDRVLLSQQLRPLPASAPAAHGSAAAPPAPLWNVTMIGADRVWSELGIDGTGITVGTSDSGVDGRHPALSGGFRGGDDSWYDPWNGTPMPTDRGGHGTHTLASAVGGRNVGVAPGARWVACVNLDRNLGSPARYLDCLQFLLAPFPAGGNPFTDGRPDRAPHVVTSSWGCPSIEGCDAAALRPATGAFAAAGIFFVAAAGNTGPRCGSVQDPPAPYADVLTVGAVDAQRMVTLSSGRGPAPGGTVKPDVVAPGAGVLSAMPGGGYAALDGTSMATPHVAGVVALMWSANPALVGDLARTRQILRDTATVARPSYRSHAESDECGQDANITGSGLVDAYAAVRAAREAR